jgi:GNAT superfamily N-acetyltransferase
VVQFKEASVSDLDAVVALFDANVAWLVENGRSAQGGSEPFSGNPKLVGFVRDLLADGLVTIAEADGVVVGASVVSDHPMSYVPPIEEEERYLELLIVSPANRGERIGQQLIERARAYTIAEGVDILRVDCWSGGDRKLVGYYESQGFTPTQEIEVRPGATVQVFEWRPKT